MSTIKSKKYFYLRYLAIRRKQKRQSRIEKSHKKKRRFKTNISDNYKSKPIFFNEPVKKYISSGTTFSLLEDPLNIVRIINSIEAFRIIDAQSISIEIDLIDVVKIDSGAICMLLAKVNEVTIHKKIRIFGTFPRNEECKRIFMESGASDYMSDM